MDNTNTRDTLALERTRLANERTFLAYVRTSLSLIAAAVVIFQFFPSADIYIFMAGLFACSGVIVLGIGLFRFNKVRRLLR